MLRKILPLIAVLLITVLAVSACAGDRGSQGPAGATGATGDTGAAGDDGDTGATGDTGAAGADASVEDIAAAVEDFLAPGATAESIATGGLLYDKWWVADTGATEPTTDNALWALQSTNTRSLSTTWRCKECHGWDYKGSGGAYSGEFGLDSSHETGFTGVARAAATMTEDDLLAALQGGTDYRHDFSAELSQASLDSLVDFLKYGLINNNLYIDYATKAAIGADVTNGETLYGSACAACHGADGKTLDFGGGDGIGDLADANPWEFVHKVRAGQPGVAGMPSALVSGWSLQDVIDVLGYAQTLPTG